MTPEEASQLHEQTLEALEACMGDKDLDLTLEILESHADLWFSPQGLLMLAIKHNLDDTFIYAFAKGYAGLDIFEFELNVHQCVKDLYFANNIKPYGTRVSYKASFNEYGRIVYSIDENNKNENNYLKYERYRCIIKLSVEKVIIRFFEKFNIDVVNLKSLLIPINLLCLFVYKNTVLHVAAERGYTQMVEIICNIGCDIKGESKSLLPSAFELAYSNQHMTTAQAIFSHELLASRVKLRSKSLSNEIFKLLRMAELLGQDEISQVYKHIFSLITRRYVKSCIDTDGNTLLHWAARQSSIDAIQHLLTVDSELKYKKNNDGETALHTAIKAQVLQLQIVELLIDAGIEIDCRDARGRTALHLAIMVQSLPLVMLLVYRYRADPLMMDQRRKTSLDYALSYLKKYEPVLTQDGDISRKYYRTATNIFTFLKHLKFDEYFTISPCLYNNFIKFKRPLLVPPQLRSYLNNSHVSNDKYVTYHLNDIQKSNSSYTKEIMRNIKSWLVEYNKTTLNAIKYAALEIEDEKSFIDVALCAMALVNLFMNNKKSCDNLFIDSLLGLRKSWDTDPNLSLRYQVAQDYFMGFWLEITLLLHARQCYQRMYGEMSEPMEKLATRSQLPYESTAEIEALEKEWLGQTNSLSQRALLEARTWFAQTITSKSAHLHSLLLAPYLVMQTIPTIPEKHIAPLQFLSQQVVLQHGLMVPGSKDWCRFFGVPMSGGVTSSETSLPISSSSVLPPVSSA